MSTYQKYLLRKTQDSPEKHCGNLVLHFSTYPRQLIKRVDLMQDTSHTAAWREPNQGHKRASISPRAKKLTVGHLVGAVKFAKQNMGMTALIPGLKIQLEGVGDAEGRVVATTINFFGDDLKTAEAIQAGLKPMQEAVQTNAENIEANKQDITANKVEVAANRGMIESNQETVNKRFAELTDFDVSSSVTVYFASGSSTLADKDKDVLMQLGSRSRKSQRLHRPGKGLRGLVG